MDDRKIVDLYFNRDEQALLETQSKYGAYLKSIAQRVLKSRQDAEECVNDTYQRAWDSIPPNSPQRLSTYLGKITRNLSISRLTHENALKRNKKAQVLLSEVEEFIPDSRGDFSTDLEIKEAISSFLNKLSVNERVVFVRRYFYASSVKEIAEDYCLSQSNVKVILYRTRKNLKQFLEMEGISV